MTFFPKKTVTLISNKNRSVGNNGVACGATFMKFPKDERRVLRGHMLNVSFWSQVSIIRLQSFFEEFVQ